MDSQSGSEDDAVLVAAGKETDGGRRNGTGRLSPSEEKEGREGDSLRATMSRLACLVEEEQATTSLSPELIRGAYDIQQHHQARIRYFNYMWQFSSEMKRAEKSISALHSEIDVQETGIAVYAGALCALKVALLDMKQKMEAERGELLLTIPEDESRGKESPLEAIIKSFKLKYVVSSPAAAASSDIINEVTSGSDDDMYRHLITLSAAAERVIDQFREGGNNDGRDDWTSSTPKREEALRRALAAIQYELENDDPVAEGQGGGFEYHHLREGLPWLHGAIREFCFQSDAVHQRRAPSEEAVDHARQ